MKITELQHEDSIWTWPSKKSKRVSLWIPYVQAIKPKGKKTWIISYNGGEVEFTVFEIDFILIYGDGGDIPVDFLDDLRSARVSLIIHRRNIAESLLFFTPTLVDKDDILTYQILTREHGTKNNYITKELVAARCRSMNNLGFVVANSSILAMRSMNEKSIRSSEAIISKRYWGWFYEKLSIDSSRRSKHPINSALDAGSKFLYGIILRWVLYHKFSPSHGFLHITSDFPSLVYDLMEPYRYIFELAVMQSYKPEYDDKKMVQVTLSTLKAILEEEIYCPTVKKYIRRKNLCHGIVLSLRSYVLKDMKKFVIPIEGQKNVGRPLKIAYHIPGGKREQSI